MTASIKASADGLSAIIQVGGADKLTVNSDGSLVVTATPSQGDNSKKLATTEFVNQNTLGLGQSWQNVIGSRAAGTTYYNTTGKLIKVSISLKVFAGVSAAATFSVNGVVVGSFSSDGGAAAYIGFPAVFDIPAGASYVLSSALHQLAAWTEYR